MRPARRLRVLVAEDNPVNQKLAQHLLERRGHTPILVGNGREACDTMLRDSFDLVLMDLQMPEMDGFEATAVIRKRERETGSARVPIIALTAHAMQGDRQRCLDADMDGYVAKPIKPVELFEVIDRVIAAHAANAGAFGSSPSSKLQVPNPYGIGAWILELGSWSFLPSSPRSSTATRPRPSRRGSAGCSRGCRAPNSTSCCCHPACPSVRAAPGPCRRRCSCSCCRCGPCRRCTPDRPVANR